MRREGFDDVAVGDDDAAALVDHPVEFGLKRLQVGDLALDLGAMRLSDGVDRRTGLVAIARERE